MTKKNKTLLNANMLRNLLIAYAVLASTIAIFLFVTFFTTYQTQQRIFAETDFKMMAQNAALSVFDAPQRLAGGQKLYLPEAKLAFPVTPGEDGVLYKYQAGTPGEGRESWPETINFASKSAINSLLSNENAFECQRLVTVAFERDDRVADGPFEYVDSVKLSDGREIFLYQNKSDKCTPFWSGLTASSLIEQLKKAEVYTAS